EMNQFYDLIRDIKPFDGSYTMMISDQGTIISSPYPEYENKPITEFPLIAQQNAVNITDSILMRKSFSFTDFSNEAHPNYISFVPFSIGSTNSYWYIAIVVPTEIILAGANQNAWISLLAGLFGILILAFIIWIVAKKITTPLKFTTKELNMLATGAIDQVKKIKITTHDELSEMGEALNKLTDSMKKSAEFAREIGMGRYEAGFSSLGKSDILGNALIQMRANLIELRNQNNDNNWRQESIVKISELLQGDKTATDLGNQILSKLAEILNIQMGALFAEQNDSFKLISSYAYYNRKSGVNEFKLGEGLVGQAALEMKTIAYDQIPEDYITIKSGLGETKPAHILVVPLVFQNQTVAVLELASSFELSKSKLDLIHQISENLAIGFNTLKVNTEIKVLLNKTQEQAEELRAQQEELIESNKVLEEKSSELRSSAEELQQQQEELRVTNEELIEKTNFLEQQRADISEKNLQLENTRNDLERKAEELAIASKYKSEFLANMSHELRTPLNSLLILSNSLAENRENNLTGEQVESAEIIYKSGTDLLTMINDILDLSKIEAGKMSLNVGPVNLKEIANNINSYFKPLTDPKKLKFEISFDSGIPEVISTDQQKVEQVLKNFMSNAIKFTSKGGITLAFTKVPDKVELKRPSLNKKTTIAISVSDTGIGIAEDKQREVFEAFKQADGSISRKFGGTGLGLSISRELAKLLGGEIQLSSIHGSGSTFTFFIPITAPETESDNTAVAAKAKPPVKEVSEPEKTTHFTSTSSGELEPINFINDDSDTWIPGDKVILIVEDDPNFAKILVKQCHEKGFKCIASPSGEMGYELAVKVAPIAIILDINLPGIDGWKVLDLLKENQSTRHIPVHIMSGEDETIMSSSKGAIGYLTKPAKKGELEKAFSRINEYVSKKVSSLLLVEDDENLRKSIKILIGDEDVSITEATTGEKAMELLRNNTYECMILDLGLSDMTGFELIEKIEASTIKKPPIIIYTGKDLTREENEMLNKYAETIIIKGVKSEERLLDETALFMHRVISDMPKSKQSMINKIHNRTDHFKDKQVLIVDDDMRNIFALTKVLTEQGMKVTRADNGLSALEILEKETNFDLILMDIMMPELDGYQTIKRIREMEPFKNIPVIALTAKAMKEDRQKCIDAGASDYMAKPLNIEKLLSLLRVWLYK
ncbi:MAG: response regulator, partial [Bacteroidales bacterium]